MREQHGVAATDALHQGVETLLADHVLTLHPARRQHTKHHIVGAQPRTVDRDGIGHLPADELQDPALPGTGRTGHPDHATPATECRQRFQNPAGRGDMGFFIMSFGHGHTLLDCEFVMASGR
ncbi:hypothetical protein A6A06_07210 [Streptomyces sp. CB02923]|nr:hypothetical protein A6A06_07210 [Streptomyces sp. CB02923]